MTSRTIRLLLLFILAVSAGAYAQDGSNEAGRTESGDEEQTEQVQAGKKDDKPKETSDDIAESFRPSEKISEDLSVSFPVDI